MTALSTYGNGIGYPTSLGGSNISAPSLQVEWPSHQLEVPRIDVSSETTDCNSTGALSQSLLDSMLSDLGANLEDDSGSEIFHDASEVRIDDDSDDDDRFYECSREGDSESSSSAESSELDSTAEPQSSFTKSIRAPAASVDSPDVSVSNANLSSYAGEIYVRRLPNRFQPRTAETGSLLEGSSAILVDPESLHNKGVNSSIDTDQEDSISTTLTFTVPSNNSDGHRQLTSNSLTLQDVPVQESGNDIRVTTAVTSQTAEMQSSNDTPRVHATCTFDGSKESDSHPQHFLSKTLGDLRSAVGSCYQRSVDGFRDYTATFNRHQSPSQPTVDSSPSTGGWWGATDRRKALENMSDAFSNATSRVGEWFQSKFSDVRSCISDMTKTESASRVSGASGFFSRVRTVLSGLGTRYQPTFSLTPEGWTNGNLLAAAQVEEDEDHYDDLQKATGNLHGLRGWVPGKSNLNALSEWISDQRSAYDNFRRPDSGANSELDLTWI